MRPIQRRNVLTHSSWRPIDKVEGVEAQLYCALYSRYARIKNEHYCESENEVNGGGGLYAQKAALLALYYKDHRGKSSVHEHCLKRNESNIKLRKR